MMKCRVIPESCLRPLRLTSRHYIGSQPRHALARQHILLRPQRILAPKNTRIISCVASPGASDGNGSAPSSGQLANTEAPVLQMEDVIQQNTPEELAPLIEALERARQQQEEATGIREALEAEAQEVAQLAINANDSYRVAQGRVEAARAELETAQQEKDFLVSEMARLQSELEQELLGAEGEDAAIEQALVTETQDLGIREVPDAEALAIEMGLRLEEVSANVEALQEKLMALEVKAASAKAAADNAEAVASAAMSAAESAVREEMEAAAVAKSTASALNSVVAELKDLGVSFETSDKLERTLQAKGVSRVDLEAAVDKALTSTGEPGPAQPLLDQRVPVKEGIAPPPVAAKEPSSPATSPVLRSMEEDVGPSEASGLLPGLQRYSGVMAVVATVAAIGVGLYFARHTVPGSTINAKLFTLYALAEKAKAAVLSLLSHIPLPEIPHGEEGLFESIYLLLTSVIVVPLVCKLPGGSPVLGFLAGGALIGPHALGVIKDVEAVRHLAELGVVFLLFNIGLELSLERLRQMQKYVFGLGSAQVCATLAVVAYTVMAVTGLSGPASIVLGGGLALSSTAVAMQVLQDRGETGSRHGRATFAVLLFQDLAVVVLLMLIPLLAPNESGAPFGLATISKALGLAAIKAVACIGVIIAGGRTLLRPIYRRMADMGNTDVFAATTLLVVLGTSVLTQIAGLSLALGAFLAGLLIAETEFALQVESDIAPYKGLLMGLFFMTVGMEISVGLFFAKIRTVIAGILGLLVGKVAIVGAVGPMFGLSRIQSLRAGLLLASGGEFAFVAFGEAVSHGLIGKAMVSELFLVVALTMALTPFLAEIGQRLGKAFEKSDVKALQATEGQTEELRGHVIIAGFGRVGQIIGQLLAERLIPFVAVDVRMECVQAGKELDLPVYFGDAGSSAVLHSLGAHHAACAVITLDTPGANYRSVWALHKHFPHVKIYVRAHDVQHGLNLEKAGATAVVPETLEPSLQLASAVLSQLNMPPDDVQEAIQEFRRTHIGELQALCKTSGSTLGYGFPTMDLDLDEDDGIGSVNGDGTTELPLIEVVP
ncbi:probable glutathione-regulated potassium-efflux system protein KefB at C-terminar half [Coccomyxa sp. Obi]|nr:probable glutathione-regulated potassium-efflux system protein KefB at C-terminar half [Coccomyxa sp. Obi]